MDSQTNSGRRVDGIIQPVAPYVAGHQNDFQYYSYSAVANVLDGSVVAFPVSPGFSAAELKYEEAHSCRPANEEDERVQKNCKYTPSKITPALGLTDADRPADVQNMPVGLQVLGRRLQEEQVLAMMKAQMERPLNNQQSKLEIVL